MALKCQFLSKMLRPCIDGWYGQSSPYSFQGLNNLSQLLWLS